MIYHFFQRYQSTKTPTATAQIIMQKHSVLMVGKVPKVLGGEHKPFPQLGSNSNDVVGYIKYNDNSKSKINLQWSTDISSVVAVSYVYSIYDL